MIRLNGYGKEPLVVRILIILMIFEIPYFNFFLIAATLIILYLVAIKKRKPVLNLQMFILTLFISLYFVIDTVLEVSTTYKIWYAMSVVFIFMAGYYTKFDEMKNTETSYKIRNSIALIAKTYFCYVAVSILYSAVNGQFGVSRNPLNIWTGYLRAATHYGTMMVIPLAYGIFLLVVSTERKKKISGAFIVGCAVLFSLITASRTNLFFIPIGFLCAYYYNIKVMEKFERKHVNQILVCLVVGIICIICFNFNVFNIKNIIMNSQMGQRYINGYMTKIFEDGRMVKILYLMSHVKESFLGGGFTRLNVENLHNLYLNVYDLSGIVPFSLLAIFTIGVVKSIRQFLKNKNIDSNDKVLLFVFYVLAFLQLLIEPVMESVPVFFWCLMYISGMVQKLSIYCHYNPE